MTPPPGGMAAIEQDNRRDQVPPLWAVCALPGFRFSSSGVTGGMPGRHPRRSPDHQAPHCFTSLPPTGPKALCDGTADATKGTGRDR